MNKCIKCEKNVAKLTLNQAKLNKGYLIIGINKNYDIIFKKNF